MVRTSFNSGWTVRPKVSSFTDLVAGQDGGTAVILPHDAMITLPRSATESDGPSTGYFPGGVAEYRKVFDVPAHWRERRVHLEFQGVYRDAMVFVNDAFAGQWRNGYAPFRIGLDPFLRHGQPNTVRVEARAHRDSRWYSGLGLHRDVFLVVAPATHIAPDGVRVTTPDVDDQLAVVEVATTVANTDRVTRSLALRTEVLDTRGTVVAQDTTPVTALGSATTVLRRRLHVPNPHRWSVEDPYLHQVRSTLALVEPTGADLSADTRGPGDRETHRYDAGWEQGEVLDSDVVPLGIRTLQIDPRRGLRINGKTVKLRGACLHADNGPLGSAAIGRAEERRIEILKSAGFNAIRSSHNLASPAMLDACDRLGMLVVDEAFDMWLEGMKAFDYSLDFPEWWQRDLAAMVAKDFNHPSVIMYSVGNEVPEAGSGAGAVLARELAEKVHALDPTRFTTNAISSFWSVSAEILNHLVQKVSDLRARGVNDVMNAMDEFFAAITTSDLVTRRTAETHAAVDVAGLNYAEDRYTPDATRFPNRVVLGTESNPDKIDLIWALVQRLPHVLGDFTWTGWDYLGEAGLGRTDYADGPGARSGGDPDYPWLLAWCGDIDITGHRRPASYYREIVFGLRAEPYLAVFRPQHHGRHPLPMSWAWTDTVSSWSWDVPEGSPVEVEVYSDAEEVELLLEGVSLGRAPVGPEHRYRARFQAQYRPGTLTAVAYDGGVERARTRLSSAGPVGLVVEADRTRLRADDSDLAFVAIELRDVDGNLATGQDRVVSVQVSGDGVLQALGSARPSTEELFDATQCTTFDGRVLAVVRPTTPGRITLRVSSAGLPPVSIELLVAQ